MTMGALITNGSWAMKTLVASNADVNREKSVQIEAR